MGETVGVNPDKMTQLAQRLTDLLRTLETDGPRLRGLLQQWGGGDVLGPLTTLIAQAGDDAREMSRRARLAHDLVGRGQPDALAGPAAGSGWIWLDWEATSAGSAQAHVDASRLREAAQYAEPADRGNAVRYVGSVARDDPDYLTTFWSMVGPIAPQVARMLHGADRATIRGTAVLTSESRKILSAFGASLAAASKSKLVSRRTRQAITRPDDGDMWSAAMLFKFGPDGHEWDPELLADMGRAVLDWRRDHPVPPLWWTGLFPSSELDPDEMDRVIVDLDPAGAVLSRVAESPAAARAILTSPAYARDLVSDGWQVTGASGRLLDLSGPPGRVVVAATSERVESGPAAPNVLAAIAGTPLPRALTCALATMAAAHVAELAEAPERARALVSVLAAVPDALGVLAMALAADVAEGTPSIQHLRTLVANAVLDPGLFAEMRVRGVIRDS